MPPSRVAMKWTWVTPAAAVMGTSFVVLPENVMRRLKFPLELRAWVRVAALAEGEGGGIVDPDGGGVVAEDHIHVAQDVVVERVVEKPRTGGVRGAG